MRKVFLVTPTIEMTTYVYPWFAFGESIEEVSRRFPDCKVKEDK